MSSFGYDQLLERINSPGAFETGCLGQSVEGRMIPYVKVGNCPPVLLVVGGFHAREHVTVPLVLELIRPTRYGTVYYVPCLNVDGVELCVNGLSSVSAARRKFLKDLNGGSEDFSLWKANVNGVDLNLNYPSGFGKGEGNLFAPAPQGFVGPCPLSEPESMSLAAFTADVRAEAVISFHSKGEVIYWRYGQKGARLRRDRSLARRLSKVSGYRLGESSKSHGGFKDWCVECLKIPAYTVEVGAEEWAHPVEHRHLPDLVRQCEKMTGEVLCFLREQNGRKNKMDERGLERGSKSGGCG